MANSRESSSSTDDETLLVQGQFFDVRILCIKNLARAR
jgi:hypothetical protein